MSAPVPTSASGAEGSSGVQEGPTAREVPVGPHRADEGGASVRFWKYVDSSADCWRWTARKNRDGYGTFWDGRNKVLAHRWSWVEANGEIPDGLVLDHLCRTRSCVRPDHLRPVTSRENVLAPGSLSVSAIHVAKTHCPRGHELAGDNLIRSHLKDGRRACRSCSNTLTRAAYCKRHLGQIWSDSKIQEQADVRYRRYVGGVPA
jgi:hypothetical protein